MTWELKELQPWHSELCQALVEGQGRQELAVRFDTSPYYITWLCRQKLIKEKIAEFTDYADQRLLALTDKSVDVIADVLQSGSNKDRLNAARLQLEAVNRVGKNSGAVVNIQQKFVVHVPAKSLNAEQWITDVLPQNADTGRLATTRVIECTPMEGPAEEEIVV